MGPLRWIITQQCSDYPTPKAAVLSELSHTAFVLKDTSVLCGHCSLWAQEDQSLEHVGYHGPSLLPKAWDINEEVLSSLPTPRSECGL